MAILIDVSCPVKHTEERDHIDSKIAKLEATLLALKRRRNLLAPVSILAQELLLSIFELLQPPKVPSDGRHTINDLLAASQVCAHWRNLTVHTPSFWKHILVFDSNATREFLNRSGPLHPLSITMRMDQITESWIARKDAIAKSSLRLFETQNSRIQYLELLSDAGEHDGWKDQFYSFTKSLSTRTFEKLHTLILGCKFDPYGSHIHDSANCDGELQVDAFIRLPSLQVLELYHCVAFSPLPPPGSLNNLTTLRIFDPLYRMDVSKAISVLQRTPNLSTLELVRAFDPAGARGSPRPFSLPHLQQLIIRNKTSPSLVEFLDAFNPSPRARLRVSLYLDAFEGSHLTKLVPFLQKVWTGRKMLSVGLSSSPAWDCHLRLHSEPAFNPETGVDCTISYSMPRVAGPGGRTGYIGVAQSCCNVLRSLDTSYIESFSTCLPMGAFDWEALTSALPRLSCLTIIHDITKEQELGWFNLNNHFRPNPNSPGEAIIVPQVHTLIIDMGPGALPLYPQTEIYRYVSLRDETGSRCKKIEFRTTPLSTNFAESLREYVDSVDGIVDDDVYAGMYGPW